MLCAINEEKQSLRDYAAFIKRQYIQQVRYASAHLLCNRHASILGNSLGSKAVKIEVCGVVTKVSVHAHVGLGQGSVARFRPVHRFSHYHMRCLDAHTLGNIKRGAHVL